MPLPYPDGPFYFPFLGLNLPLSPNALFRNRHAGHGHFSDVGEISRACLSPVSTPVIFLFPLLAAFFNSPSPRPSRAHFLILLSDLQSHRSHFLSLPSRLRGLPARGRPPNLNLPDLSHRIVFDLPPFFLSVLPALQTDYSELPNQFFA